jgi:hypothetical protein
VKELWRNVFGELAGRRLAVSCPEAAHDLFVDSLNSTPNVDGVERDALESVASARAWMRERRILPTYAGWLGLMEPRAFLQAVHPEERTPSDPERVLTTMNCTTL